MPLRLNIKISGLSFTTPVRLLGLIIFAFCCVPPVALPMELCWQSLAPETGEQDTRLATTEPSLSSNGMGEVWLSWQENGPRILRWANGRWSQAPFPEHSCSEMVRYPVVSAGPSGVFLAVSANGKSGTSALHLARWSGESWEWLGEPLISSLLPYTHAHEASFAFWDGDQPVVAWSEERGVKLAGLFAARWDGSQWHRLGALAPEGNSYYLSPTVVVDTADQIWLCWKEGQDGVLRVARWDGAEWRDIGRESLRQLSQGSSPAAKPSLVIDSKARAWVLWSASAKPRGATLALARWNGTTWTRVPVPDVPGGKGATVWSAQMILRDDVPLIAWSQSDETDNHRLYAAEWAEGDRWIQRLTGLHLVEGISNVRDIRLATGDSKSIFVSWDETGEDKRRTRLVRAYTCKQGETPAAPPKSIVERDTWPKTVEDAVRNLVSELDDDSKARVRSTSESDLVLFHHGWGTGIRNSFGLWRGNDDLLKSCGNGKIVHPDECSTIIIKKVWKELRKP